jgi:hypothetical protein
MPPKSKREFSHHSTCRVNDVGMSPGGSVQMSCSHHAVSAVVAGTANDENAFAFLDWMEAIESLGDGEAR